MLASFRFAMMAVWIATVAGLIGLGVLSRDGELIVIAGPSMGDTIPAGSLVATSAVPADDLRPGQIVTVRADNGVLITHRILRVADLPTGRFLELRGDANPSPDPVLVPARAVLGQVDWYLPAAGNVLVLLSSPLGLLSLISLLTCGLLAIDWIGDPRAERHPSTGWRRRAPGDAS